VAFTNALKRQQIGAYGYADTDPRSYEEDHQVPLEVGGAPKDARNLWPEPITDAKVKDQAENSAHRGVCQGKITLAQGQAQFLSGR